jgi:hypothetical protein
MKRHGKKLTKKSRTHEVNLGANPAEFVVKSGSSGKEYTVTELADGRFFCTCDFNVWHPAGECSHTISVRNWLAEAGSRRLYARTEEEAERSRQRREGRNGGLYFTSRAMAA